MLSYSTTKQTLSREYTPYIVSVKPHPPPPNKKKKKNHKIVCARNFNKDSQNKSQYHRKKKASRKQVIAPRKQGTFLLLCFILSSIASLRFLVVSHFFIPAKPFLIHKHITFHNFL